MKNIAVIGAGTMGNGIAHVFGQTGFSVRLIDVSQASLDKGIATISKNLDRMVSKEKISENDKSNTLRNITLFTKLDERVAQADLVVEAATENCDSITQIAAATSRPDKVIGMHFMNPVPIMQLVEIIRGYSTSNKTTATIMELSKTLGKIPTEVNDYPGFVANHILMPMINEAIETLQHGVAGVAEIDTVMKLGMAHPMGPLQLADFIGLDVCLSILNVMHNGFKNPKYAPSPLLVNMVTAGKFGVKSGEGFYDYSESRKAETISKQFLKA